MLFRLLFAAAFVLIRSLSACAGEGVPDSSDAIGFDDSIVSVSDSDVDSDAVWSDGSVYGGGSVYRDYEYDESGSTPMGCCDEIPECGDACGDCVSSDHDSCVDWLLPRSNLSLPLMQELAAGRDTPLPLPLGSSFIFTELDRHVAISDVRLGLGGTTPVSVERVAVPVTEFHASTQVSRIDLWVLPCFNAYGIIGHTRTTGNVDVTVSQFPLPNSPPVTLDFPVVLEGPTAGFGFTSAIAGEGWFSTFDVNKTWTNFNKLDGSLTALVLTPRVGLIVDRPIFKGEVHVGAMYQDTAQTVSLTIDDAVLGNDLQVEVDQFEPRPWNFLVGGMWALNERLQLMVEGGMGGRSYILSGVTIRY